MMQSKRTGISLFYFAMCCAGGFNQVETRPKLKSKKLKSEGESKEK